MDFAFIFNKIYGRIIRRSKYFQYIFFPIYGSFANDSIISSISYFASYGASYLNKLERHKEYIVILLFQYCSVTFSKTDAFFNDSIISSSKSKLSWRNLALYFSVVVTPCFT